VESWTPEQVNHWLAVAEGGRFKNLALPAGTCGRRLLELSAAGLAELCAGSLRNARNEGEGAAWVEDGANGSRRLAAIGHALWVALRRENQAANYQKLKNIY
jgi:hypothetical protein